MSAMSDTSTEPQHTEEKKTPNVQIPLKYSKWTWDDMFLSPKCLQKGTFMEV